MADDRCRLRRPARPTAHSVHRRPVPVCLCARTAAGQRRGRHGVPAPKPPTQSRRSLRHLGREHAAAGAPPPPRPVSAPGPSLSPTPRPESRRLKRHGRQHARCRCTHAAATCLCVRNAAGSNPTGRPRARTADAVSDALLPPRRRQGRLGLLLCWDHRCRQRLGQHNLGRQRHRRLRRESHYLPSTTVHRARRACSAPRVESREGTRARELFCASHRVAAGRCANAMGSELARSLVRPSSLA